MVNSEKDGFDFGLKNTLPSNAKLLKSSVEARGFLGKQVILKVTLDETEEVLFINHRC